MKKERKNREAKFERIDFDVNNFSISVIRGRHA